MTLARHVFHSPLSGLDRAHAWQEATGEPVFIWGRGSGVEDRMLFGPVKKAFRQWIDATGGDQAMTLYHDGIGSDALGPLDPTRQKILFLHTWYPRWERHLEWTLRCTGKLMVGRPDMVDSLRATFPWIPERFIEPVFQPQLEGLDEQASHPHTPSLRTGIWLHGKPWRPYGNRLRAIVDRWDSGTGELEIICEGGGPPRWARKEGVTWNCGMPTEFALHRIFTWDSTLLLNDFTLDSPWLLRALALDCFPLVPDGESPASAGPWEADAAPRPYAWGDMADARALLLEWRENRDRLKPDFLKWRSELLAAHADAHAFREQWEAAKSRILQQRSPGLRRRKAVADWQPVSWYERVLRLRAGV